MPGPDFIGIGMERAGSSWLFYMLASHPDIWVPPLKELHYFDSIENGHDWRYRQHLKARILAKAAPLLKSPQERPQYFKNYHNEYLQWDARYFTGKKSDNWYRALFDRKFTRGRISGEITATYAAVNEKTIADMAQNYPETKIILSIRDPVERTQSALFHHFRGIKMKEPRDIPEEEMLAWLDSRIYPDTSRVLELWSHYIAKENLILVDFTRIEKEPEALIRNLYERLAANASYRPAMAWQKIFSFRKESDSLPPAVLTKIMQMHEKERQKMFKFWPSFTKNWHNL